jgi:hypothetical protein
VKQSLSCAETNQKQQQPNQRKNQPNMKRTITALTAVSLLAAGQIAASAATGEVTLSGSTWTGKVDGSTKYTGTSMAAACNACKDNMSSGTINIRNSGNKNGTINLKSNVKVNGNGVTISGSGTTGVVYAANASSTGASNIQMSSSDWYGMYFRTCNGQAFSGVNGTAGIAYRIDNCKGGTGYTFSCGSPTLSSGSDNGVETYGISGNSWSTVTATDRGACGLLLNYSSSASGSTVKATRCNYGGGYAGFRTANNNRSTTLTYDNATSCGRGYFSVSGSSGATVTRVNATKCSSHGVWLQSTSNTKVSGGTITGCNPCSSISQDLGGNTVTVTCR